MANFLGIEIVERPWVPPDHYAWAVDKSVEVVMVRDALAPGGWRIAALREGGGQAQPHGLKICAATIADRPAA